jgi:HD superfamily phosphohydrolase
VERWEIWLESAPSITGEPSVEARKTPPEFRRPSRGKSIIHRDQVHGDVHYDQLSVALLNTSALQRLGRVHQLGYSHLVFRGGTHTRLSHVMGAAYMAGTIVDALRLNYKQRRAAQPRHVALPGDFLPGKERLPDGTEVAEAARWDLARHLATWAALLHDVGHVPLGHTLEDEFEGIFKKHDDFASPRALRLWQPDSEIHSILIDQTLYPASFQDCGIEPRQVWETVMLICYYKDVGAGSSYSDFRALLNSRIDEASKNIQIARKELSQRSKRGKTRTELLNDITAAQYEHDFASILMAAYNNTRDVFFHPFLTDIVANTICADYLDYVRRDPLNVGLDVLWDNRILSHFYISEEPRHKAYRMALALLDRHGKPRLDVCTGVVEQVRQRYRFAESIYYHKTKVSASAMFAKAMSLVGKPPEVANELIPLHDATLDLNEVGEALLAGRVNVQKFRKACLPSGLMHPEMGDEVLHLNLLQSAISNIETIVTNRRKRAKSKKSVPTKKETQLEEIEGQLRGIALLQGIFRRQLYKVSVSINAIQFGRLTRGASPQVVVEERLKYMLRQLRDDKFSKNLRSKIERDMAAAAGWPVDTIILYVPERKIQAKGIETFAFDTEGVVRLNEHPAVSEKVAELGRDYQKLWRLLVLTHPGYQDRFIELSAAIDVLVASLWSNFGADLFGIDLHDSSRVSAIRESTWFPYVRKDHREAAMRVRSYAFDTEGNPGLVDWDLFERSAVLTTEKEESLASSEYADRAFLVQCLVERLGADRGTEDLAIEEVRSRYPSTRTPMVLRNGKASASDLRTVVNATARKTNHDRAVIQRGFEIQQIADEIAKEFLETHVGSKKDQTTPARKKPAATRAS